jgi:hypothetical protein
VTTLSTTVAAKIHEALSGHSFWEPYLAKAIGTQSAFALHLAVCVEPYLRYILEGKKTVESRFSKRQFAPYHHVDCGDVVLLKKSSGPVVGICLVTHVWFYRLNPDSWNELRTHFAQALCASDPAFWQEREQATYATLMRVREVQAVTPISLPKRDRRGWVVLQPAKQQLEMKL